MTRWSRPIVPGAFFCRVYRRDHSAHTLCGGRWSSSSAEESCEDPPQDERCGRCAEVQQRGDDLRAAIDRAAAPDVEIMDSLYEPVYEPVVDPIEQAKQRCRERFGAVYAEDLGAVVDEFAETVLTPTAVVELAKERAVVELERFERELEEAIG